jgi:hypothetical protein
MDVVDETLKAYKDGKPVPGQSQCTFRSNWGVIGTNGEDWVKVHIVVTAVFTEYPSVDEAAVHLAYNVVYQQAVC